MLSADLSKVTVNDGGRKSVYDVTKYNLADYKNTQVQLILQYDALSVAAKGVYEPSDKFASPILEYTFARPVEEGAVSWTSDGAVLDDISVYSLDNTYKAASVSYEQDPNDADIWISKLKAEETKAETGEGISTLFIVIYSVIGAVVLALLGVIIAQSVKKRRKEQ